MSYGAGGGVLRRALASLLVVPRWLIASLRDCCARWYAGCCGGDHRSAGVAGADTGAAPEESREKHVPLEDGGCRRSSGSVHVDFNEACDQGGYWGVPAHGRAGGRQQEADAAPRQRRSSHSSTAAAIAMRLSLGHSNLSALSAFEEEEEPCQAGGEDARESQLLAQGGGLPGSRLPASPTTTRH